MFKSILKGKDVFFELIERSVSKISEGMEEFRAMLNNYTKEEVAKRVEAIKRIEKECDEVTHEMFEKLNTTFVTPIDREDLHELISKLDNVMDMIHAASLRMHLFNIDKPTEEVIKLVDVLSKSVEEIKEAIKDLRNLKRWVHILEHCIEVNSLENEGDNILRGAIAKLFNEEKDPIYIMKWKEIYETIEEGVDYCEDVANVIESIILKNA